MGEYLYDHYCYTPNVKRLQQTKLATFKNDPNYYETGDCYTEVILGWGQTVERRETFPQEKIDKTYFQFSANKNGVHGQAVHRTMVQAYR